jgi:biopolymer transport protein ExbB/TolQ
MEYIAQIITPHGATLILLMVVSTAAMARIFSLLGDLRAQADAIEELVPHLRAALSTGNIAKAAVSAESDGSCIGRLMAAILREPTHNPRRMRIIYKLNIDDELRARLRHIAPLRGWAIAALLLGIAGAIAAWMLSSPENVAERHAFVVGAAGIVVSIYAMTFFSMLRRREIELNDALASEALNLIDTATRFEKETSAG